MRISLQPPNYVLLLVLPGPAVPARLAVRIVMSNGAAGALLPVARATHGWRGRLSARLAGAHLHAQVATAMRRLLRMAWLLPWRVTYQFAVTEHGFLHGMVLVCAVGLPRSLSVTATPAEKPLCFFAARSRLQQEAGARETRSGGRTVAGRALFFGCGVC